MKTTNYSIFNILFVDIETVGIAPDYEHLEEPFQKLWNKKAKHLRSFGSNISTEPKELYKSRAAIYAEFGKIICISVGYYVATNSNQSQFKTQSFFSKNESEVLISFKELLENYDSQNINFAFCGHNIKEFDIPYLCRRMLVNNISIPEIINHSGKKPWQITNLIDTLELWRFGDYKNYTSLDLLAQLFNISSPKDKMNGSEVHAEYWEQNNLDEIVAYCQKDVITVAKLYLHLQQIEMGELSTVFA